MAGRRLRDAVRTVLTSGNKEFNGNVHVVIAGLTNTYSQYVTTFEEYQVQRYEVSKYFRQLIKIIVLYSKLVIEKFLKYCYIRTYFNICKIMVD